MRDNTTNIINYEYCKSQLKWKDMLENCFVNFLDKVLSQENKTFS